MFPYGYGLESNYPPVNIEIGLKKLGRGCRAMAKMVSRSAGRRQNI